MLRFPRPVDPGFFYFELAAPKPAQTRFGFLADHRDENFWFYLIAQGMTQERGEHAADS
jgi:hypothetical protein